MPQNGVVGQAGEVADGIAEVGTQAVFVMPLDFLAAGFVLEGHRRPGQSTALALSDVLEAG